MSEKDRDEEQIKEKHCQTLSTVKAESLPFGAILGGHLSFDQPQALAVSIPPTSSSVFKPEQRGCTIRLDDSTLSSQNVRFSFHDLSGETNVSFSSARSFRSMIWKSCLHYCSADQSVSFNQTTMEYGVHLYPDLRDHGSTIPPPYTQERKPFHPPLNLCLPVLVRSLTLAGYLSTTTEASSRLCAANNASCSSK